MWTVLTLRQAPARAVYRSEVNRPVDYPLIMGAPAVDGQGIPENPFWL
jgi:hypothetical protein